MQPRGFGGFLYGLGRGYQRIAVALFLIVVCGLPFALIGALLHWNAGQVLLAAVLMFLAVRLLARPR